MVISRMHHGWPVVGMLWMMMMVVVWVLLVVWMMRRWRWWCLLLLLLLLMEMMRWWRRLLLDHWIRFLLDRLQMRLLVNGRLGRDIGAVTDDIIGQWRKIILTGQVLRLVVGWIRATIIL